MYFKAEIDENHVEVQSAATLPELLTSITVLINSLYEKMPDYMQGAFKFGIHKMADDELPFISEEERAKKAKEVEKELAAEKKKKFDDELQKLFDGLRGLVDDDSDK